MSTYSRLKKYVIRNALYTAPNSRTENKCSVLMPQNNKCIKLINNFYHKSLRGYYRPSYIKIFFKRLDNAIPQSNKDAHKVLKSMVAKEIEMELYGPPIFEDLKMDLIRIIKILYKLPDNVKITFPFNSNNPDGKDERKDDEYV